MGMRDMDCLRRDSKNSRIDPETEICQKVLLTVSLKGTKSEMHRYNPHVLN